MRVEVRRGKRVSPLVVFAALLLAAFTALAAPKSAGAASCETQAGTGYTVEICITSPTAGSALSGSVPVSATVSVSAGGPGVQRVLFFLDGKQLLTDYAPPYTFELPTADFVDGAKTLEAEALLRNGSKSSRASISLQFNNGVTSPPVNTNTFTPSGGTTPAPGQQFKLHATGDGASGEPGAQAVTDLIAAANPNLFLYLGDVYEKGTATEFHNWYGTGGTFYGRFRSITNPTVGNHEYEDGQAPGYFDYWDNVPNHYSFNAGGWHFISLNSTTQFDQSGVGSPQYQWLEQDLQSNTATCTIAYFHHPRFSIGPQGDTTRLDPIWALLASHGVDVALAGHDHDYQRWVPLNASGSPSATGLTQFVVGTGGHGTQGFVRSDSRVATSLSSDLGSLELRLGSAGATFAFLNPSGSALDSGSLQCSGSGSDAAAPTAPANLTAAATGTRVDLSWSASSDNVGVTGYKVYRNGTLLADIGNVTTYVDGTVSPQTSYTYEVRARDAAGNVSAPSNSASVSIGAQTILFSDGFESGSLSQWTSNTGVTVQQAEKYSGASAARTTSTGAATWAYRQLPSVEANVYYRMRFKVVNNSSTVNLLKFRTPTGGSILGVYLASNGKLSYRNDIAGVSTTSTTTVSKGNWHELQVHVTTAGAASQTETWLNGVKISTLSKTENFGTSQVGRVQIGENSTGRTYDVAMDAVAVATAFIADGSAPATPTLTLSENSAYGHVNGTTVYYNPSSGSSGSFKVAAGSADAESTVFSMTFPATFGNDGSVDTVEPFERTYSFAAGATASGQKNVWATNGAGLSTGRFFTVTPDSTAPTGGSISYLNGYVSANAVLLSLADGQDAGSGLDESGESLERSEAPLTNGACGNFGGYAAIIDVPVFDFVDTSVVSGRCYKYRLVVPDNVGNRAVFTSGSVVKVDADAPSVSLDNPGSTVSGIVGLTATATDAGGSGLQNVRFERSPAGSGNWTLIGTSTASPYSASWDTTALSDGNYDLRAVARDGAGGTTSSDVVSVTVQNDADGPTVALTAPADGATVSGTTTISATATDDVGVSQVEFLVNGTVIGTDTSSPYSVSWNTTSVPDGGATVTARATDTSNKTTTSAARTVTVANAPPPDTTVPSVALTAPDEGATVAGSVTISATASDNVAVQKVDFLVDGDVVGTDTSSPYSVSWDTTGVTDGPATITAQATDTSGNVAISAARSVTVDNSAPPPVDTTPPTVELTEPANGATVSGTVTVSADASDNVAVTAVEFLVNGNVAATDTIAPYSFSWDTTTIANGAAALRARATDLGSNTATSSTHNVTVDNAGPPPTDTTPPSVALTAPADGQTVSGNVTISADASDDVAVQKVEFLVNGSVVGTDTSSPYSVSWDSTTVSDGTVTVSARATDTSTNATTSATRNVSVDNIADPPGDTTAPTVSLADPGNFLRGTKTLSATASDDGGVANVVFQLSPAGQNAWSTIVSDASSPYTAEFVTTTVADGAYDFRAVATDSAGNSANSVVSSRIVDNTGASGSITSPASGAVVSGTVSVAATATDAGSGVSQITFERSPAGQNTWTAISAADTTEPYSVNWATNSLTDGNYDIRGVLIDDAGNQSTTSTVTVEVRNRHTFVPVADAYVNAELPTRNYGPVTNLRVDASPVTNSYVRFNVDVSGSARIVRATLRIFTLSSSTTGYEVRGVTDNTWGENTINYNNAPPLSATVTGTAGGFAANVWTTVDVTSLVSSGGLVTFGLTTPSTTSKSFGSREAGANSPQLIVETG